MFVGTFNESLFKSFARAGLAMRAPPYLVSFENIDELYHALSDDTLAAHQREIAKLVEQKFPPVVSIRCLAVLFGFSPKFVGSLLSKTEKYYRVFSIQKGKSRKQRRIEAPKVALKIIQKWLAEHLATAIQLDDCIHGFVPGRSYITAAKKHLNAHWVYSIDIENFFQATKYAKVEKAFRDLNYPEHGAKIAAKLCCYNGHLAQGSPASPVLSNLIFREIDKEISLKSNELGITYTRYADDLVFSGQGDFPEEIKAIKHIIEQQGWVISTSKEHFSKLPNRLKVHGLLVHGEAVRLTKGYRNKVRTFKHLIKNGKASQEDIRRITGHISLANYIEQSI